MLTELLGKFVLILDSLGPWLGGAVAGLLLPMLANRRKLITYTVSHDRIGITANDNILGSVSVKVGEGYTASNLYLSKVAITNRSFKDIADITLTVYVDPSICHLLTETKSIRNSVTPVYYSDEYEKEIRIQEGDDDEAKNNSSDLWKMRRVYFLPTFNRGASLDITYLVDVAHGENPGIYVDVNALGVRIKYKEDPFVATHIWGVHVRHAALTGIIFCLFVFLLALLIFESFTWPHLLAAIIVGIFCAVPGAIILRVYNYLRSLIAG